MLYTQCELCFIRNVSYALYATSVMLYAQRQLCFIREPHFYKKKIPWLVVEYWTIVSFDSTGPGLLTFRILEILKILQSISVTLFRNKDNY